jgi:hypothetical protein
MTRRQILTAGPNEARGPRHNRDAGGFLQAQARVDHSSRPVHGKRVRHGVASDKYVGGCTLLRIALQPTTNTGLQKVSQVMVDKAVTVKRDKVGAAFGRIDSTAMVEVDRCLAVFLGIAK